MDGLTLWQLLRLAAATDALLSDQSSHWTSDGEVFFASGSLEFSLFDKGFETIKDAFSSLDWNFLCRKAFGEEPLGIYIELSKVESATTLRVTKTDLERIRERSFSQIPACLTAMQNEEFSAFIKYAFGAMQATCHARSKRDAQPLAPLDPRLPPMPAPIVLTSVDVRLTQFARGAAPSCIIDNAQTVISVPVKDLPTGPSVDIGRNCAGIVTEVIGLAAAAGFCVFTGKPLEMAVRREATLLAALIAELRRTNQIAGAKFPVSVLEQIVLFNPTHPCVGDFIDTRSTVEFPASQDLDALPQTYLAILDGILVS